MRVEKGKPDFRPISLVLETPEDVKSLCDMLHTLVRIANPLHERAKITFGQSFTIVQVLILLESIEELDK